MNPLRLNLLPHRPQQRRRRRLRLVLQLLAVGGLALSLLLGAAAWLRHAAMLQAPQRQRVATLLAAADQASSSLGQVGQQLDRERAQSLQLQDWRRQRELLPRLLRQLRQLALEHVAILSVVQQDGVLQLQASTAEPELAGALLLDLRRSGVWGEVEWRGWRAETAGRHAFALCLAPPRQSCTGGLQPSGDQP